MKQPAKTPKLPSEYYTKESLWSLLVFGLLKALTPEITSNRQQRSRELQVQTKGKKWHGMPATRSTINYLIN